MSAFLKTKLELQIKSSDAVFMFVLLASDGTKLPAFGEKVKLIATTFNNSIYGCISTISSYINLPFLL